MHRVVESFFHWRSGMRTLNSASSLQMTRIKPMESMAVSVLMTVFSSRLSVAMSGTQSRMT